MDWLYYVILLLVLISGLVLTILTLPGNWLMIIGDVLFLWVTGARYTSWWWILVFTLIATVAEVIEFAAAGKGAKKVGGTLWGTVGALAGALLGGIFLTGLIPIPILGTLIGILVGTFAGAMLMEWATGQKALKSAHIGYGAAKGRLYGTILKFAFGVVILLASMVVCLPIGGKASAAPTPTPVTTKPSTPSSVSLPETLPAVVSPTPAPTTLPTTIPAQ